MRRGLFMRGAEAALAFGVVLSLALPVSAQQSVEVVVGGLDNPRGLSFGPEGALYLAQAGRGGPGPCIIVSDGSTNCLGATGKISRIRHGAIEDITTGLPSLAAPDGSFALGPHDVSFQGRGNGLAVIGLASAPSDRDLLGATGQWMARLLRFQPNGGFASEADIAALEEEVNPDGGVPDTDPYAVQAGPGGEVVVDAGGNAAWWVKANGGASVLAVFPDRLATAPWGQPIPMQSVPNAVTLGPDGAYYVGELTGFPFPVGEARVYRVVPGAAPTIAATGFTNIIDLAFGADGSLYVLELATNGLLSFDLTSRIVRVWPNGSRTSLNVPGLFAATGLTMGPDGALYASNLGVFAGIGQVLRIVP